MAKSYKPEVQVKDDEKWYDNAMRFETEKEAEEYARDLFQRWTTAMAHRAVASDDDVNYKYVDGRIMFLDGKEKPF